MDQISKITHNQTNVANFQGKKGALNKVSVPIPLVVDVAEVKRKNNSKIESVSSPLNLKHKLKADLLTPRRRSSRLNQKLNKDEHVEDFATRTEVRKYSFLNCLIRLVVGKLKF